MAVVRAILSTGNEFPLPEGCRLFPLKSGSAHDSWEVQQIRVLRKPAFVGRFVSERHEVPGLQSPVRPSGDGKPGEAGQLLSLKMIDSLRLSTLTRVGCPSLPLNATRDLDFLQIRQSNFLRTSFANRFLVKIASFQPRRRPVLAFELDRLVNEICA